jgi:hypothetical protein
MRWSIRRAGVLPMTHEQVRLFHEAATCSIHALPKRVAMVDGDARCLEIW